MGSVICDFLQDDGIIVIDGRSSSISRIELTRELSSMGCGDYRLLTLHRLPGALVVGYEVGADRVTRVYGKLVGEFFEALGRVVVGVEVLLSDRFKKPKGLAGPYFIVAVAGAELGGGAAHGDRDLLAVDLSASGILTLPSGVFDGCSQLAAVAFPP
jgi:hypothetical protein